MGRNRQSTVVKGLSGAFSGLKIDTLYETHYWSIDCKRRIFLGVKIWLYGYAVRFLELWKSLFFHFQTFSWLLWIYCGHLNFEEVWITLHRYRSILLGLWPAKLTEVNLRHLLRPRYGLLLALMAVEVLKSRKCLRKSVAWRLSGSIGMSTVILLISLKWSILRT